MSVSGSSLLCFSYYISQSHKFLIYIINDVSNICFHVPATVQFPIFQNKRLEFSRYLCLLLIEKFIKQQEALDVTIATAGHCRSFFPYQIKSDSGNNLIAFSMVPAEISLLSELLYCSHLCQIASSFIKELCCKVLFRTPQKKIRSKRLELS